MPRQRILFVASEAQKFMKNRNGMTGASTVQVHDHSRICVFHSGSKSATAMVRSAPLIAAKSGIANESIRVSPHTSPAIICFRITINATSEVST